MLQSLVVLCCLWGQSESLDATRYAPLYSEQGEHPWDALHRSFFVRRFTTGETYHHRFSFDAPWIGFQRLSKQDEEYQAVLRQIDAIDQLPHTAMEQAAAVRRLIFFRDLWCVFEKLARMESPQRSQELRRRLAAVMQRLELNDDEIRRLPDTLSASRTQALFLSAPDASRPERPFLPTDLLDDASAWITISPSKTSAAGAPAHSQSVDHRSLFSIHMLWPEGKAAGEKFLATYRQAESIEFPAGTQLALVRRALAATTSGKLKGTKVVESVQLLVSPHADKNHDLRYKFVLDRAAVLAGQPGLVALEEESPIDAFGFESTGQWSFDLQSDADGEVLVLGRHKTHGGIPSLGHCVACHGRRNQRFHANSGTFPVYRTTNAAMDVALETEPPKSAAYRDYLELRTAE